MKLTKSRLSRIIIEELNRQVVDDELYKRQQKLHSELRERLTDEEIKKLGGEINEDDFLYNQFEGGADFEERADFLVYYDFDPQPDGNGIPRYDRKQVVSWGFGYTHTLRGEDGLKELVKYSKPALLKRKEEGKAEMALGQEDSEKSQAASQENSEKSQAASQENSEKSQKPGFLKRLKQTFRLEELKKIVREEVEREIRKSKLR